MKKNILSLIALALLFLACTPKNNIATTANTVRFSSLSEKATTCEASLLKQMETKSLLLKSVKGLESDIQVANQSIAETTDISFSADKRNQVTALDLEHSQITDTTKKGISYSLSLAETDSAGVMALTVEIENIKPTLYENIDQEFSVSESCELSLVSTAKDVISKSKLNEYNYSKITVYLDGLDGPNQTESDQFTIPQNATLLNLLSNTDDLKVLPPNSFNYIPKIGLASIKYRDASIKKIREFDLELFLDGGVFEIFLDNKPIFSAFIGTDEAHGIKINEGELSRSWTMPKAIWKNLTLGTSEDLNELVKSEIPKDYFTTHNSIQLVANKAPTYEHFGAYWTVSDQSVDPQNQLKKITLTEKNEPTIADKAVAADLASNDTIQTQLPRIQEISKNILARFPNDRTAQIQMILEYLGTHYTYDHEMIKSNVVRSLTTEEALDRGKGVCQHYAVIFTAIARALKIPARIITGYYLGYEKPGAHAWVEAEVKPNLWRVIEPQSATGLVDTRTRLYFPTSRATFLEDKKQNMGIDYIMDIMSSLYTFKPSPL